MKEHDPMQSDAVLFRNELRDRYEELLLFDYHFATEHDVESRMWKFAFYKQIEEFKLAVRRRAASGHGHDSVLRGYRAFLLVLPSLFTETWGLVMNEAMQLGVPCIVSDRVGCDPDMIRPGDTVLALCLKRVAGYSVQAAAD